ncbi:MAG: hypothetical protein COA67_00810 [Lutibacter sp.]|nr:MAG: hypothetical protein COA67_00810 [Lutibacter sp.]
MISVVILGSGNVATHLTRAFLKANAIDVVQVYSRNLKNIDYLKKRTSITDDLENLKDADVYIISITDDAIDEFSKRFDVEGKIVVHTSGSVSMNALKGNYDKGVFYPLQTFTKDTKVKFKKIPICIESSTKKGLILLEKLASSISKSVFTIDSKQREKLHLSAVFVNNFANHLYQIGNEICEQNNVPFEVLYPLIKETAKKVTRLSPKEIQTGPAKRNDVKVMEKQLSQLSDHQKEIYKLLSASILKTHK